MPNSEGAAQDPTRDDEEAERVGRCIVSEAEHEARTLLEVRERDALHDVHGRAYRRKLDLTPTPYVVNPVEARKLDGYVGSWKRQYRSYLQGRLAAKSCIGTASEAQESASMRQHDELSQLANDFFHAVCRLVSEYDDRWVAHMAEHDRSLEPLRSEFRNGAAHAEFEASAREAGIALRRRGVVSNEEPARQALALTETSERSAIERVARKQVAELNELEALLAHAQKSLGRKQAAARAELELDEADCWLAVAGYAPEAARRAALEELETSSRSDVVNYAARHLEVAHRRAGIVAAILALLAEQSRRRASLIWSEADSRRDVLQAACERA